MKVPGKIFILGEYSVLNGYPALVAAVTLPQDCAMYGFGSSTARFVEKNANLATPRSTEELWYQYKKEFPDGSGADLVAQDRAYRYQERLLKVSSLGTPDSHECRVQYQSCDSIVNHDLMIHIQVFSAAHIPNRKLRTNEALSQMGNRDRFPDSQFYVSRFLAAQSVQELVVLGEFADAIANCGLESDGAKLDRDFISKQSEVITVKGCGGGLNDVFLVVTKRPRYSAQTVDLIHSIEEHRKLKYLGDLSELLGWSS